MTIEIPPLLLGLTVIAIAIVCIVAIVELGAVLRKG